MEDNRYAVLIINFSYYHYVEEPKIKFNNRTVTAKVASIKHIISVMEKYNRAVILSIKGISLTNEELEKIFSEPIMQNLLTLHIQCNIGKTNKSVVTLSNIIELHPTMTSFHTLYSPFDSRISVFFTEDSGLWLSEKKRALIKHQSDLAKQNRLIPNIYFPTEYPGDDSNDMHVLYASDKSRGNPIKKEEEIDYSFQFETERVLCYR